jgi:hypothetical protein
MTKKTAFEKREAGNRKLHKPIQPAFNPLYYLKNQGIKHTLKMESGYP